ncbi:ABC transporter permease [Phyllobacterium endophyticum]|uniref:ABC transporter permease n=1 Tax=Phyllobacterium endophyticum TaxID=1149773 RepID=A0A2P7AKC5_9HYPH|nr:ABC transporter permease subunit [Phyllobacterium endophyticum]MBB3237105.1 polar amino acid transport system permease protein [Phyllobacterium endophyticum]PSH54659.1 ABC transporter permease [Phyllobacterium endophyticum]TYR40573.1 ABC transporter permease subunit [Phyllobacterium endophyticum]
MICPSASQLSSLALLGFGDCGWGAVLLAGFVNSLLIAIGAYALGFIIGITGAFGKLYGGPVGRDLWASYTTLVRAVPELVLILILYYAVPGLINEMLVSIGHGRIDLPQFVTGIIVLSVVQGAYQTEVLRGAIIAVPQGQIQAARAMGMSPAQVARRVIFPLMTANAVPGLGNQWLNATKDTALLAVIGFAELSKATYLASSATKAFFTFYSASMLLYLIMSLISIYFFGRIEKWARKGQRSSAR